MAIYPGCEKFENNKKEAIKCFSEKFGKDIQRFLNVEFPNEAANKVVLRSKLEFHVTKNGTIEEIKVIAGDKEFTKDAEKILNETAAYLIKKNKKIQPAKLLSGEDATLKFQTVIGLDNPEL